MKTQGRKERERERKAKGVTVDIKGKRLDSLFWAVLSPFPSC